MCISSIEYIYIYTENGPGAHRRGHNRARATTPATPNSHCILPIVYFYLSVSRLCSSTHIFEVFALLLLSLRRIPPLYGIVLSVSPVKGAFLDLNYLCLCQFFSDLNSYFPHPPSLSAYNPTARLCLFLFPLPICP